MLQTRSPPKEISSALATTIWVREICAPRRHTLAFSSLANLGSCGKFHIERRSLCGSRPRFNLGLGCLGVMRDKCRRLVVMCLVALTFFARQCIWIFVSVCIIVAMYLCICAHSNTNTQRTATMLMPHINRFTQLNFKITKPKKKVMWREWCLVWFGFLFFYFLSFVYLQVYLAQKNSQGKLLAKFRNRKEKLPTSQFNLGPALWMSIWSW